MSRRLAILVVFLFLVGVLLYSISVSNRLPINKGNLLPLTGIRTYIEKQLVVIFTSSNREIVQGVLLGTKSFSETVKLLSDNGVAFLLAVSGIKFSLLQQYGLRLSGKFNRKLSTLISLLIVLVYYLILDKPGISSIRAVLMLSLFGLARLFGRRVQYEYILLVVLIILEFIDPQMWLEVGFQLMLGSILAIHYLLPLIRRSLGLKRTSVLNLVGASFVIWLAITPIIYINFGELSVSSLLASVFVLPFITLLFSLLIPGILITMLLPSLGELFFRPLNLLVNGFILIQQLIHKLSETFDMPDNLLLVVYLVCLVATIITILYRIKLCKLNVFSRY